MTVMSQDESRMRKPDVPAGSNPATVAIKLALSVLGGGVAVLVFVAGFAVYDWVAIPSRHTYGPELPPYWNLLLFGFVPVFALGAIGEFILAGQSRKKAVLVVAIIGPLAALVTAVAVIAQLNP
jgi:hypothetical protein